MFKNIRIENYKGFANADVPIRPITLLLGRNSSGKTSLIQLLLALHQSHVGRRRYPNQFLHNGRLVNFGPAQNLWKFKDTTLPLSFSFQFQSKPLQEFLVHGLRANFTERLAQKMQFYTEYLIRFVVTEEKSKRTYLSDDFIKKLEDLKQKYKRGDDAYSDSFVENLLDIENELQNFYKSAGKNIKRRIESMGFREFESESDLKSTKTFIDALGNASFETEFWIRYELSIDASNAVYIKCITIQDNELRTIVSVFFEHQQTTSKKRQLVKNLKSDFMDDSLGSMAGSINSHWSSDNSLLEIASPRFRYRLHEEMSGNLANAILTLLDCALGAAFPSGFKQGLRHVPPLRAHPRRYYLAEVVGSSVDEAMVLESIEDYRTRAAINDWLQAFGVSIKIESLQEVIKSIVFSPSANPDFSVEIADVGFGYSQILPVVVSILSSPPNSVLLIEQPEVHLHPDMQAAFGDLVGKLVQIKSKEAGRSFIIETHSEYLLTEIRAQVAKGAIKARDVVVLFFESDENGLNQVRSALVEQNGSIKWPTNFIERHFDNQKTLIRSQIKTS